MSKCYTVFYGASGQYQTSANGNRPQTLEGLIASVASEGLDPNAWAPEASDIWGGEKEEGELYAESIAAGRLIEKTPSGWVALGAEKQERASLCEHECAEEVLGGNACADACGASDSIINAPMLDRDLRPSTPAEPVRFDPFKGAFDDWTQTSGTAPQAPSRSFGVFRSPDLIGPSGHLNASRHQMAGMKG